SPFGRAIVKAARFDSSPYHGTRGLQPALTIPVYERPNRILRKPAHRSQGRGSGAKLNRLDGHGVAIEPWVREEDHLFTRLRGPAIWEQDCYLLPGRMSERLRRLQHLFDVHDAGLVGRGDGVRHGGGPGRFNSP